MVLPLFLKLFNTPLSPRINYWLQFFWGGFLGAGFGLSIRGGGVLDGTEVLAIYLSKKTGLTIGDLILVFNIIIFSAGAYLLSIETVL